MYSLHSWGGTDTEEVILSKTNWCVNIIVCVALTICPACKPFLKLLYHQPPVSYWSLKPQKSHFRCCAAGGTATITSQWFWVALALKFKILTKADTQFAVELKVSGSLDKRGARVSYPWCCRRLPAGWSHPTGPEHSAFSFSDLWRRRMPCSIETSKYEWDSPEITWVITGQMTSPGK